MCPCIARDDLKAHAQIEAIEALETYKTPLHGTLTVPRPPTKFEGENPSQAAPSPTLGEHSRSILEMLGYSSEEIDTHIADGSVACS